MPTSAESRAELVGNRLHVFTNITRTFLCQRIPGARWLAKQAAWSYPATPKAAKLIAATFADLRDDPALAACCRPTPPPVSQATTAALKAPAVPSIATIPGLKTSPWKHQLLAWVFLLQLFATRVRGAMLAMDMGTGKSLVAVAAAINLPADLILILCPLRVVDVWPEQFEKHAVGPVIVLALGDDAGSVKEKLAKAKAAVALAKARGEKLVVVINYESAWREPFGVWALVQQWGLVICDEAHKCKSPSGRASNFISRLGFRAAYRLALTGTPLPHSHLDIFSPYRFLDRSIYGTSYIAFRNRFSKMGGFKNKQVMGLAEESADEFKRRMQTIAFRVGKDVLDLPPTQHITNFCVLGKEAARIYRGLEDDLIADVENGVVTAANAMVRVLRLQQVTGGFVPVETTLLGVGADERPEIVQRVTAIDDAKRRLLEDVLEDIGSEPVVIFCRFRADMDAVHEACSNLKLTSLELSGRRDELTEWKTPQARQAQVLAVQIQAGGTGVDLTRARYAIYYSTSFSLADYDQSLSRTHRPGQTRPVTYIHLLVKGTVDERIQEALDTRADVIAEIVKCMKGTKS